MKGMLLTQSEFSCHSICPKRWDFRYLQKLSPRKRSVHLDFGSAIHHGLEAFYKRENVSEAVDTYIASTRERAERLGIPLAENTEMMLEMVHHYMGAYAKVYEGDFDLFNIMTVEPVFEVKHPGAEWLKIGGKFDLLVCEKQTGNFLCWENKTVTTWDEDINRLMLDFQISTYAWALSRMLSIDCVEFVYNIIKKPSIRQRKNETESEYMARLASDLLDRKDFYFKRDRVLRSKREIELIEKDLLRHAIAIKTMHDDPSLVYRSPGEHCTRMCSYKEICIEDTQSMRDALYTVNEVRHPELNTTNSTPTL